MLLKYLPLILIAFVIPLLVTGISILIRFRLQRVYPSGLDILVAKSATDFAIALSINPWLSLVSPIFRPAFQGLFVTFALVAIALVIFLAPLEDGLARNWATQHLHRQAVVVPATLEGRFPHAMFFLSWTCVIVSIGINIGMFLVR